MYYTGTAFCACAVLFFPFNICLAFIFSVYHNAPMNGSANQKIEEERSRKQPPATGISQPREADIPKPPAWWYPVSVLKRFLVFLFATVIVSVAYKGIIALEFFQIVSNAAFQRFIFCAFELFLLGVYWHYTFLFSKECRHRSPSLLSYYLMTAFVFLLFSAVYLIAYFTLDSTVFQWIFRITLNLCGLRLSTTFPADVFPYMIAYLAVTFLIMMTEPQIAIKRYQSYMRWHDGFRD